jgi:hypothetical protein
MEKKDTFERELNDLRSELENFQQEKERVRAIIGKIGGVPTFNTRLFNWFFIAVIAVSLIISFILGDRAKLAMIEFATVALSIKILYMMHCQTRVNHFQLWMQSSLEWRINEMTKLLREIKKEQDKSNSSSD